MADVSCAAASGVPVRVHVRRAERVVLEAAAVRVGLLHRPQDHRDVAEALREHRRHHAERERHEVRDEHVGTVLLPLTQQLHRLVLEGEHVVGRHHLHAGKRLEERDRVRARGLEGVVRPVDFAERQVADLERVSHCFFLLLLVSKMFRCGNYTITDGETEIPSPSQRIRWWAAALTRRLGVSSETRSSFWSFASRIE